MNFERLADDRPHAHSRIERSERILKHHLHFAAQRAQGGAARGQKIAAIDEQFARVRLDQAQQHARERGLAAAGFADNGERFARGEFEAHIVDGRDAGRARPCERARRGAGNVFRRFRASRSGTVVIEDEFHRCPRSECKSNFRG